MKRFLSLCGLLILLSTSIWAQELNIGFERLDHDLKARRHERLDLNDVPCALIRVSGADIKSYTFDGNVVGDVVYSSGEAWVYMSKGSRRVTLNSDKFGMMIFEFPERLEKQVVYKMTLKVVLPEDQKTRTLVMPVMGIGKASSYGVMVGIVKKWGGYVKVKHNFKSQSTDLVCDEQGNMEGSSQKAWLTGKGVSSRFALTGGVLWRVALPIYVYGGLGYGYKKLAWEMPNDVWAEVSDHSTKGLETEVGGIFRYKNYAFSLGFQNNQFKYWEANIGVAFMF